jgi:hypothetical protein
MRKLTFEFVQKYFKEQNCELLETEYINNSTKMKYRCNCGSNSEIIFNNFKKGSRCQQCAGNEKYTYEFVQNYFKKQNCELLSNEYINTDFKMKYICECKNKSEISFYNFKNGQRCMKCSGNEKLTFEFVQKFFKEQGCELLSKIYIGNHKLLNYKCICGNISDISFASFQNGTRCMKCSGNEKLTFEFVRNYFKEQKCELLSNKYINSNIKMEYICDCGNKSKIKFSHFYNGVRCKKCSFDKISKISKYFKDYTLPSGNIIRIQGYEHLALDELTKLYKEQDIFTNKDDVPKVLYQLKNKQHRYYPDIYIKSENKVIEVKSTWTYKKNLIKIMIKALATRKLGYDFEFWIYHPDKKDFKKIIV